MGFSFKKAKNQGNALLTVMIAVGLLGFLMTGIIALVTFSNKQNQIVSSKFGLEQIRRNLSTMLGNASVWAATVANNASLGCLQSPPTGVCNHGSNLAFSIYSAGGASFFNPATQGFRFDGTICTLGTENCAIGMTFETAIECPGAVATCAVPSSIIARGTFANNIIFPGNTTVPYNPQNYLITVRQDSAVAAGTSGLVLQFKCADSSGNPCVPLACPAGFSDGGTFQDFPHVYAVLGPNSGASQTDFSRPQVVRTCYK